MPKRKQCTPTKAMPAKRQQLSWNMTDTFAAPPSSRIVDALECASEKQPSDVHCSTVAGNKYNYKLQSMYFTNYGDDEDADNLISDGSSTLRLLPASCLLEQNVGTAGKEIHIHEKKELNSLHDKLKLSSMLMDCHFLLKINLEPDESKMLFKIGELSLNLLGNIELCNTEELYLYVNENDSKLCVAYLENKMNSGELLVQVEITTTLQPDLLRPLKKEKLFQLVLSNYYSGYITSGTIHVDIYITQAQLYQLNYPSEVKGTYQTRAANRKLFNHLLGFDCPDYKQSSKKADLGGLFIAIKEQHRMNAESVAINIQSTALIPVLRPYQQDAVIWMLNREGFESKKIFCKKSDRDLHMLYREVNFNNKILYYNTFTGGFTLVKPLELPEPYGGILADEMGLGKTVEVLACILLHPRSDIDTDTTNRYKKLISKSIDKRLGSIINTSETDAACHTIDFLVSEVTKAAEDTFVSDVLQCYSDREVGFLECTCGVPHWDDQMRQVQCQQCYRWQHSKCVNYYGLEKHYLCPHCLIYQMPVKSKTTLIVSPKSICHQWVEEIEKHVRNDTLKLLVYKGVRKHGFIQPSTLGSYDIVLTTYEIFSREINNVDLPHGKGEGGRCLRHPKRFMAIPSPLTAVQWWRVCLDEAQMVESANSQMSKMALKLSAINRWCVTGTPIQHSINDLQGLFMFLGYDPYWEKVWWKELLLQPYYAGVTKPMCDAISKVMWRTAKKDVEDQIQIPLQTEKLHWLTFSPVEEHFYRRQYNECSKEAHKNLSKWHDSKVRLANLDRQTMHRLLHPLLRLRQACCHPQAVRGQFIHVQRNTMTMEELLENLIKKSQLEAENAHRQLIASLNGLAGVSIINGDYVKAAELYREVLRSVEGHSEQLKTDSFQQLHTLHNLHEILTYHKEGIPPTLRDHQLHAQAMEIRDKHLNECVTNAEKARKEVQLAQNNVDDLAGSCDMKNYPWWTDAAELIVECGRERDLIVKLWEDLDSKQKVQQGILHRYDINSITKLQYVIASHVDKLESARKDLLGALKLVDIHPTKKVVNESVECHLRPLGASSQKCCLCKCDDFFVKYEAWLFLFVKRQEQNEEQLSDSKIRGSGSWADSEVETALKIMLHFVKLEKAPKELILAAEKHFKVLEMMKKQFKSLRALWTACRDHISMIDEINMATTRLRLRLANEEVPKMNRLQKLTCDEDDFQQPLNVLEPTELEQHKLQLKSDQILAEKELQLKLGHLNYLKNLEKADYGKNGSFNPDTCPTCYRALGVEWSVLVCGHCFCLDCIKIMAERYSFGGRHRTTKCAVCRNITQLTDISYVSTSRFDKDSSPIQGSHSTKVEAIVRCLLNIQREDVTAKSLIFSTWADVLNIIADALDENKISYRLLHAHNKYEENLTAFKQDPSVKALLLPIHSGAKGLNLIEAAHVLITEPVLNPANEVQAIGRVHRIGQTQKTYVHKFLVRNTIEEKMHNMMHAVSSTSTVPISIDTDYNTLTIGDLNELFEDQV